MASTVLEYFNKTISLEETDLVPVVIWGVTLWYSKKLGIKAYDYYHRYEYMMKNIDRKLVEDYGYVEGSVFFLGPLEVAAAIRGYCGFLTDLYDEPEMVHKLLEFVTDTLLEWLHYVETKIGKLQRVIMADHFPCQVSPQMFEEFCFPYFKKIFEIR